MNFQNRFLKFSLYSNFLVHKIKKLKVSQAVVVDMWCILRKCFFKSKFLQNPLSHNLIFHYHN